MECLRSVLPAPNGGLLNRAFISMETERASQKLISSISAHHAFAESTHPINLPSRGGGGFAVSPDGKWLLYSRIDETASDLMLVENFR